MSYKMVEICENMRNEMRAKQLIIVRDADNMINNISVLTLQCTNALAANQTNYTQYSEMDYKAACLAMDYDEIMNQYESYKLNFNYFTTADTIDFLMVHDNIIRGQINIINKSIDNLNDVRLKCVFLFSAVYGLVTAMPIELRCI